MTFSLIAPNGREETVLSAKFNFNWQLGYELEEPIRVRKGTRMVVVAHHDNSANNPYNPMVLPWFGVIVDKNADPERILSIRQDGCWINDGVIAPLSARTAALPFPLPTRR